MSAGLLWMSNKRRAGLGKAGVGCLRKSFGPIASEWYGIASGRRISGYTPTRSGTYRPLTSEESRNGSIRVLNHILCDLRILTFTHECILAMSAYRAAAPAVYRSVAVQLYQQWILISLPDLVPRLVFILDVTEETINVTR